MPLPEKLPTSLVDDSLSFSNLKPKLSQKSLWEHKSGTTQDWWMSQQQVQLERAPFFDWPGYNPHALGRNPALKPTTFFTECLSESQGLKGHCLAKAFWMENSPVFRHLCVLWFALGITGRPSVKKWGLHLVFFCIDK